MDRGVGLWLVVLLALVSDAHKSPEQPIQSLASPEGRLAPLSRSTQIWIELWGDGWGEVRSRLTEPASFRLQVLFRSVLDDATLRGFVFREPALYQTNEIAHTQITNPPLRYYGRYFAGPNYILVDRTWTDQMDDREVRVLLAHEVGHSIDIQTERLGHVAFREVYHLSKQEFADHIARLLMGDETVDAFKDKYVRLATNERLLR